MHVIINILIVIVGGLWRRWWGGWLGFKPEWLKIFAGFGLPFAVAFIASQDAMLAVVVAGVLFLAFLDPLKLDRHSAETTNDIVHSLLYWASITSALGALFGLTGLRQAASAAQAGHGFFYAPIGVLVPLGYVGFKRLGSTLPRLDGFLDGYTTYGELWLGAIIFGGLALFL